MHDLIRSRLLVLGAVVCLGCETEQGEPTFPVSGKVTRNGTPVEGVAVFFVPDGDGQSAVGITDASGEYLLTTRKKDDGAAPGRYRVSVAKYEAPPVLAAESNKVHADYDISNEYPVGYNPDAADGRPAKNLLPGLYADPNTSGFEAVVTEGKNTHDFDLKR